MNNPDLIEILQDKMVYESADDVLAEGGFEEELKQYMPDYDITVIDMDEYGAISSVGDTIAATVQGKTVEDIQTTQWCTEEQDVYYYIIAIKLKED